MKPKASTKHKVDAASQAGTLLKKGIHYRKGREIGRWYYIDHKNQEISSGLLLDDRPRFRPKHNRREVFGSTEKFEERISELLNLPDEVEERREDEEPEDFFGYSSEQEFMDSCSFGD